MFDNYNDGVSVEMNRSEEYINNLEKELISLRAKVNVLEQNVFNLQKQLRDAQIRIKELIDVKSV